MLKVAASSIISGSFAGTNSTVTTPNKVNMVVNPSGANNVIVPAVWSIADYQGSGSNGVTGAADGHLLGVLGWMQNSVAQTVTLGIGLEGKVVNNTTGQITNAVAIECNIQNNSTGIIGNAIGFSYSNVNNTGGGTLAHAIGYYYGNLGSTSSDKYIIKADDTSAKLARKIGSGATVTHIDMPGLVGRTLGEVANSADTSANFIDTVNIPGGTLKANGDTVRIIQYWKTSANANTKRLILRVGANSLDTGAVAFNAKNGVFEATITRTGSNTQRLILWANVGGTLYGPTYYSSTETDTSDIPIYSVCQNGTAAANEIILIGVDAVYYPTNFTPS